MPLTFHGATGERSTEGQIRMTLLFHAGGTPTLPSIAALKGARASCPPEPRRLLHLITLGALTSSSARNMSREVKADEDVGVPRG
jgi:hypothetical protein